MLRLSLFVAASSAFAIALGAIAAHNSEPDAKPRQIESIIRSYVEDFRTDRYASEPTLFGIEVPEEGSWHVRVTGEKQDNLWGVELYKGPPPQPTFVYRVTSDTLRAIDRGDINALTAQAKMFASDYAPMDAIEMDGYSPTAEQNAKVNPFSFHFWTRGFPELVPFGEGMTRQAHGADVAVFYYQTGIRTAWLRMASGDRVRDSAREQAAPFPMLAVAIRGISQGEVDGTRVTVKAGNAVFIPPSVMHKWWNENEEDAEVILIMFGEGA